MNNPAVVVHGVNDIRVEDRPYPENVEPNEVLLEAKYGGICGSDMHILEDGHLGKMVVDKPYVIGHEVSAEVIKVGSDVTHLQVGDYVSAEPAVPCLNCHVCIEGKYNLCEVANKGSRGLPTNRGFFQRYFTHPSPFCHRLPDGLPLEEGALVEPLSCAVYAVQKAGITFGHNVLICGAGPIGLLTMMCAKAYGAGNTCIIDTNRQRLEVAEELGANCTVVVNKDADPKDLAESIEKLTGKVDVVIECVGSESCTHTAILVTKMGGKVVLLGIGQTLMNIPVSELVYREIEVIGINKFKNTFPVAIHLLQTKRINVKPLVTHIFPIAKAANAFESVKEQKGLKILLQC